MLSDTSHVKSTAGNLYIPCSVVLVSLAFSRSKAINHPKFRFGHLKRPETSPTDFCVFQDMYSQKRDDFSTYIFSESGQEKHKTSLLTWKDTMLLSQTKGIILYSPGTCPQQSRRGFGISYLANKLHSSCSQ